MLRYRSQKFTEAVRPRSGLNSEVSLELVYSAEMGSTRPGEESRT